MHRRTRNNISPNDVRNQRYLAWRIDRSNLFFECGAAVARNYKVGDHFYGAWREAQRLKIASPYRHFFITGFLTHMPRVELDGNGKIKSLERPY